MKNYIETLFDADDFVETRLIPEKNYGENLRARVKVTSRAEALRQLSEGKNAIDESKFFACVGVNPRDESRKVLMQKNLCVDIDGALLPEWARERADMICSRGELNHHVYFCFSPRENNDDNRADFSRVVKALFILSGGSEKSAHDPERVIRVPSFLHKKNGVASAGYEVTYLRDNIARVNFSEKFAWLAALKPKNNFYEHVLNIHLARRVGTGQGRSRELFFVGLDAHDFGLEISDAIKIGEQVNATCFDSPESDAVLRHQIESGYRYSRLDFGEKARLFETADEKENKKEREQEEKAQKIREKFIGWIYVHAAERFIECESGFTLTTKGQIENYIADKTGVRFQFAKLFALQCFECADALDFAPNEQKIFEREGKKIYNSYRASCEAEKDLDFETSAVETFKNHIDYIATTESEAKTLTNYFAFIAQNPGKKLSWAPLIISPTPGIGKSAFSKILEKIVGAHNLSTASSYDLTSDHTDFLADKLCVVVHEVETHEKNAMAKMKSLITESRFRVVAKYARTYETTNCANFLFLSNRADAMRIDDNDRRLFVIVNRKDAMPRQYYKELFETFERGAGFIVDYLRAVDLSDFEPYARPENTAGKDLLREASKSELTLYLDENFDDKTKNLLGKSAWNTTDLLTEIENSAPKSAKKYATQKSIAAWFLARGAAQHRKIEEGKQKRLWFFGSSEELKLEIARQEKEKAVDFGDDSAVF